MLLLERSSRRWWQKPLARVDGRDIPAELVILRTELRAGESGAWLNSRGVKSGTIDLAADQSGQLRTIRKSLPTFVTEKLKQLYTESALRRGAPDLVLWYDVTREIRFVEVKCPDWDRPSLDQLRFHEVAEARGCAVKIVEWRFR